MTDRELKKNVSDALEFDPSIDANHIGVAVDRGIVTLTGHVPSYGQKTQVEEVVRRVKGVRGIAQEIEVRFFGQAPNSDEDIAGRALNMINWNTFVPDDAVQVKVQDGWVTLTGRLQWQFQRQEAENAVRKLSGIVGVTNRIELIPQVSSADVKTRIENALKRNAEIEAGAIRVQVSGEGEVRLEGQVHDFSERTAVERAAWSAPGVRKVDDQLLVL